MLWQEKDRYAEILFVIVTRGTDWVLNSYCRRSLQGTTDERYDKQVGDELLTRRK